MLSIGQNLNKELRAVIKAIAQSDTFNALTENAQQLMTLFESSGVMISYRTDKDREPRVHSEGQVLPKSFVAVLMQKIIEHQTIERTDTSDERSEYTESMTKSEDLMTRSSSVSSLSEGIMGDNEELISAEKEFEETSKEVHDTYESARFVVVIDHHHH